eukprot:gene10327-19025_t
MEKKEKPCPPIHFACRKELSSLHFERLWSPPKLWTPTSFIECCRFTADSKSLLFGDSSGVLRCYQLETKEVSEFSVGAEIIWALDVSSDGEYICCCGNDRLVNVWSRSSAKCLASHSRHNDSVWSVKFTVDTNYVISCSSDLKIIIWGFRTSPEACLVLDGHAKPISHIDVSSDGKMFASCSYDQTVRIWIDLNDISRKNIKCCTVLKGHKKRVNCCSFSPHRNDILASGSADCDIILWSILDERVLFRFRGHCNIVWSCAFLRLKNELLVLSCSSDHSLRKKWNLTCILKYNLDFGTHSRDTSWRHGKVFAFKTIRPPSYFAVKCHVTERRSQ